MNKYFELGINVVEDNLKVIKSKLLQYTDIEKAEYILDNIKLDSDFYIALNKEYKQGNNFENFVSSENLHEELINIFNLNLYAHQENSIKSIKNLKDTVISTGTGSGKTESFIIPIVDYCLKNRDKNGVKAIIIYPMNALANDQKRRISDILSKTNLKFGIFTGETPSRKNSQLDNHKLYENQIYYREDIINELPDILITNYVMLDRILTSEKNNSLIKNSRETLKYVVLDEIHTYRGNKGAHLKFLLDRLRYNINGKLVHIGCSATLSKTNKSKSVEGYLYGDSLDQFICPLFNCKNHELIEAEYEDLDEIPKDTLNYDEIKIIRDELYKGSISISNLINILKNNNFYYSKQDLYNLLNKNSHILSFRVYLFLNDVQDGIKRCINCGKYHTGWSNKCLSCGSLLFYISVDNPKMMIGLIKNRTLTNDIKRDLYSNTESTFVGIVDNDYELDDNSLVINLIKPFNYIEDNCIEIHNNPDGDIRLVYLEEKPKVFDLENNQSFFDISKSILKNMQNDNRKILSFKDSRQEVSRYKNLSNDIFVSNTFLEISKYVTNNRHLDLFSAYDAINNQISLEIEENEELKNFKDLNGDFQIWFERMLRNKKEITKIYPKDKDNLNEEERLILEFFIEERLIESNIILKPNTRYINYSLFSLKKIGVAYMEEDIIDDGRFMKISLSKRGKNIETFLQSRNISYESIDIEKVISSLIRKGYLCTYTTKDKKEVYSLRRCKLEIVFDKSNYSSIKEIIDDNFFIAETHSSEVDKEEKNEIESKFQNNELNILFSTPTLEMGIDIGGLNVVFMQGVPPLPSNFAQRAGRAGRKDDKTALIMTLCDDNSYHDMYYFQNPKDMIDGVINPPKFQTDNFSLGKKHINALIYQINNFNDKKMLINELTKAFYSIDKKEINDYVNCTDFYKLLGNNVYKLYENNVFPDYSFRRDEVKVYNLEAFGKDKKEKEMYEISSREPESACKEYFPGDIKYMAGDIYKLVDNETCYDIVDSLLGKVKQYKEIYAKEAKGYISRNDSTKSYSTVDLVNFINNNDYLKMQKENIIKFEYYRNIELQFINLGKGENCEDSDYNMIGQILKRQGILISYETEIISLDNMISFIALINNSIKECYGLDDSEIKIMYDKTKNIFVLYDANGNENIDLKKIFLNIKYILKYGYDKVKNCDCKEINGCYICMKNYSLNRYSASLNKIKAYKIAGYCLGKNRLPIDIKVTDDYDDIYDIDINISVKQDKVELSYENNIITEKIEKQKQNEAVFTGLIKVLNNLGEDIEYVKISSKQKYIVDGINGEAKISKSNSTFSRYNFISLKYKNIYGEKV